MIIRGPKVRIAGLVLLSMMLGGCVFFPGSGPTTQEVMKPQEPIDYEIIDVNAEAVNAMRLWRSASLASSFGARKPAPETRVNVGDVVQVSIWEASSGGLFGGRGAVEAGSGSETLPPQTVDRDGRIKVPYVGEVPVVGKRPSEIASSIEKSLTGKAIEPQVLVTLPQQTSASVVVVGDLTGAGRVNLNVKGDRLLEVIAQAGGIKAPPHETFVRVTRGSRAATMQLSAVLASPAEDIFMQPGDTVYVFRRPQTFTALGAVKGAGEVAIDREDFTVAEAVGSSGGLIDAQADPSGVFIFRYEQAAVVRAMDPDSPHLSGNSAVPVIYRLNLKDPSGYFIARAFPVRVGDIVYVANAPGTEFTKFLRMALMISSLVRTNDVTWSAD
ncbi:polysaccharide export outer membrane protein [Angulomicrobium tetraedrale]|uniref:Polysaccharide export outer membrane protein n=1 Tax=Ancylobacter tetraedralis TaxID=217068 RepID=A0A839ZFT3_9HYPH|nr:polysaccharide biosynthesis/export family protein [Ancylobacter tetraedralis]MBB3773693.1 polysaccharide export outer membrane protein [Ancylobacter tetraedralis]